MRLDEALRARARLARRVIEVQMRTRRACVDENGRSSGRADCERRGDEGVAWNEHLVARLEPQRQQGEGQRGRAARGAGAEVQAERARVVVGEGLQVVGDLRIGAQAEDGLQLACQFRLNEMKARRMIAEGNIVRQGRPGPPTPRPGLDMGRERAAAGAVRKPEQPQHPGQPHHAEGRISPASSGSRRRGLGRSSVTVRLTVAGRSDRTTMRPAR